MTRKQKQAARDEKLKAHYEATHCRHGDRDVPGIRCGYPLPCPWHTAVIDLGAEVPKLEIPLASKAAMKARLRLAEIAIILQKGKS